MKKMEEVAERSDDMQTILATTLDTEKTPQDDAQTASVSKQKNVEEEPLANGDLHKAIIAADSEVKLKLAQEKVENLEKDCLRQETMQMFPQKILKSKLFCSKKC